MKHSERGSFTIEAILTLPVFMAAFLTIASLAIVARLESRTQYAIAQVAKEISRYCYVADRANILMQPSAAANAKVDSVDEAVDALVSFANTTSEAVTSGTLGQDVAGILNDGTSSESVQAVTNSADALFDKIKELKDDPKGVIVALAQMVGYKGGYTLVSRVVAPPLCKMLVQKYISDAGADEFLKKSGVEDGLGGLDFRLSKFLMDGRTINVVVVYTVKIKWLGMFEQNIAVKQTASTAAWLSGGTKLAELPEESYWQKPDLDRGKAFTAKLKAESPRKGVKGGVGVDLYDQDTNTFTAVHSINVFSSSYAQYSFDESKSGADKYTLRKDVIESVVRRYANGLKKDVRRIGENIEMEDGTSCMTGESDTVTRNHELFIVVPKESEQFNRTMNEIADEVERETGVKVYITYRDKAL